MKSKLSILIGTMAIMAGCGTGSTPQLGKDSVDKVIAAMTLEEKARILIGTGQPGISTDTDLNMDSLIRECRNMVPGAAGTTFPIDRLGIPAVVLTDGPAGVRIDAHRDGSDQTYYCTHFRYRSRDCSCGDPQQRRSCQCTVQRVLYCFR